MCGTYRAYELGACEMGDWETFPGAENGREEVGGNGKEGLFSLLLDRGGGGRPTLEMIE